MDSGAPAARGTQALLPRRRGCEAPVAPRVVLELTKPGTGELRIDPAFGKLEEPDEAMDPAIDAALGVEARALVRDAGVPDRWNPDVSKRNQLPSFPYSADLIVRLAHACAGNPEPLCGELRQSGKICRELAEENALLKAVIDQLRAESTRRQQVLQQQVEYLRNQLVELYDSYVQVSKATAEKPGPSRRARATTPDDSTARMWDAQSSTPRSSVSGTRSSVADPRGRRSAAKNPEDTVNKKMRSALGIGSERRRGRSASPHSTTRMDDTLPSMTESMASSSSRARPIWERLAEDQLPRGEDSQRRQRERRRAVLQRRALTPPARTPRTASGTGSSRDSLSGNSTRFSGGASMSMSNGMAGSSGMFATPPARWSPTMHPSLYPTFGSPSLYFPAKPE